MSLYTSYLGFFNRKSNGYEPWASPEGLRYLRMHPCMQREVVFEPVFVMRNRGNIPVEPPEMVLRLWKEGAITWEGYRAAYLASLEIDESSLVWMQNLAKKAHMGNVVLVCFEKNPEQCHRQLLAKYMQEHYGVDYLGELPP